tara:strand:+ start:937 stop:1272 length:336 start_codon:yes stop_codon:yes gene_type:complete
VNNKTKAYNEVMKEHDLPELLDAREMVSQVNYFISNKEPRQVNRGYIKRRRQFLKNVWRLINVAQIKTKSLDDKGRVITHTNTLAELIMDISERETQNNEGWRHNIRQRRR